MHFWDYMWLMIWGFLFVAYLMVLFQVIVDVFRDSSMNGLSKTVWLIALFIAPPVTALVYVIVRGKSMDTRQRAAAQGSRFAPDEDVRPVSGATDPSARIASAKALLDAGTINKDEFDQLKAKALS